MPFPFPNPQVYVTRPGPWLGLYTCTSFAYGWRMTGVMDDYGNVVECNTQLSAAFAESDTDD